MTSNLRLSDQAKTAFIADVTHELRTPLTVIKGTVETLEDGAIDDLDGRGTLLSSMSQETNRLIRLVNDLLTLTRADASALKLNFQPVDLEKVVQTRCEIIKPLASKKGIQLVVTHTSLTVKVNFRVLADEDRVAQVLENILDNAIRHAPANSRVDISLKKTEDMVSCSISDQGPGIPADHLPLIFERFYRVDSARDRSSGGSGLGLAIARSLVLAMGGTIEAASQPDLGTIIHFQLPAIKTDPDLT